MGKRANADLSLTYIGNRLHDAAHSRGEYDAYMDASKIVMDNAVYLFKLGKFKRALALRRQSIELERVADEIKLNNVHYWTQCSELMDELVHREGEQGGDAVKG